MNKNFRKFTYLMVCMFVFMTVFKVRAEFTSKYTTVTKDPVSEKKSVTVYLKNQGVIAKLNNGSPLQVYKKFTTSKSHYAICTNTWKNNKDEKTTCNVENTNATWNWNKDNATRAGVAAIIKAAAGNDQILNESEYEYAEIAVGVYLGNKAKIKSKYTSLASLTSTKPNLKNLDSNQKSKINEYVKKGKTAAENYKSLKKKNISLILKKFTKTSENDYAARLAYKIKNYNGTPQMNIEKVTLNGTELKANNNAGYAYSNGLLTIKSGAISSPDENAVYTVTVTVSFSDSNNLLATNYECGSDNQSITLNEFYVEENEATVKATNQFTIKSATNTTDQTGNVYAPGCSYLIYKTSMSGMPLEGAAIKYTLSNTEITEPLNQINIADTPDSNGVGYLRCIQNSIDTKTISETEHPKGYKSAGVIETDSKDSTLLNLKDIPNTHLIINKVDGSNNQRLAGATLHLEDSNGNTLKWEKTTGCDSNKPKDDTDSNGNYCVKLSSNSSESSWVSESNHGMHFVELDYETAYYVVEEQIPSGYTTDTEQWEVELTNDQDENTKELNIINYRSSMTISKQDITNKKELAGAKLRVVDGQGNVIEEWISTNEPHEIKGLPNGDWYLVEITAPDGYELNTELIEFTIKNGEPTGPVVMYNSPKKVNVPNTFSAKNIITYVVGGLLIAFGTGVLVYELKKKKA